MEAKLELRQNTHSYERKINILHVKFCLWACPEPFQVSRREVSEPQHLQTTSGTAGITLPNEKAMICLIRVKQESLNDKTRLTK